MATRAGVLLDGRDDLQWRPMTTTPHDYLGKMLSEAIRDVERTIAASARKRQVQFEIDLSKYPLPVFSAVQEHYGRAGWHAFSVAAGKLVISGSSIAPSELAQRALPPASRPGAVVGVVKTRSVLALPAPRASARSTVGVVRTRSTKAK